MKRYLLIATMFLLAACGNKNYLDRKDEEKALRDAVKALAKSAGDEKAREAIPILYSEVKKNNLNRIAELNTSNSLGRWDKILTNYDQLQAAYNLIMGNTAAFGLVSPEDFSAQIIETREAAAADYYAVALTQLDKENRSDAKQAFTNFRKADKYVAGYKDVKNKIKDAYAASVINVVINPITDYSYFQNSGFGNYGYNYANEYFQQTLVRELEYDNNNYTYPAHFYTDYEARRENLRPDWVVDLRFRDMSVPYPQSQTSTRQVSNSIVVGRDTSGRPIYQNVYATLYVTRSYFDARAQMDVQIRDLQTGSNKGTRSFTETYRWDEEKATYSGDSRALSSSDWSMINNSRYRDNYRREDILNELYRKLYPNVKNYISREAGW